MSSVGPKILNSDGTIQHSCKRSFPKIVLVAGGGDEVKSFVLIINNFRCYLNH